MRAEEYLESHWNKHKTWTHLSWPTHQERLKFCSNRMKGNTFIDVGCAQGHSTNIMKNFHPGDWTGLDFCEKTINLAKDLFPSINFKYLASVAELNFLGEFDGVVCSEVIEHVENDKELVESLWNITGASLVITTPCINVSDPGHLRLYDKEKLKNLFKDISEVNIEKQGMFFYVSARKN
jgi:2-polyprenyl-3-methyl-5-hydroxy-6-metoxy-1,4-benzoquinol methylase